jgi:alpha-L-fucosidase 2
VTFYDEHYPRDAGGKIRFTPAQSLETWWDVENPLPIVAGLRAVLPRLSALPEEISSEKQRTKWRRLLSELPPIPAAKDDGKTHLLPAAKGCDKISNSENPELYAVFPYRLYGIGKPDLDVGRRTFERRRVKGHSGWRQDEIQAAHLGLTDDAADYLLKRAASKHAGSRFPAFWGPNFDWIPDQDHGGCLMKGLQSMLLQADDGKIHVLPAWPKDWDVSFKLHAPGRTTVEVVYKDGKVRKLKVEPEGRKSDVVIRQGELPGGE